MAAEGDKESVYELGTVWSPKTMFYGEDGETRD
jgi:hypothetical protein